MNTKRDCVPLNTLVEIIQKHEHQIAYGSETALLGRFLERMRQVTGIVPSGHPDEYEGLTVPIDEASWWIAAYHHLAEYPDATTEDLEVAGDKGAEYIF